MNNGVVPDGDVDICTYYGEDWKTIAAGFKGVGYGVEKVMLNDIEPGRALYMGLNHAELPHICVSFWYSHKGVRYFCHDEHHQVTGVGMPPGGYYVRGVPARLVDGADSFAMVEWPGIPGSTLIRVPRWPGEILDVLYPLWAYHKQRYTPVDYQVQPEKMVSRHHGGATTELQMHVSSMREFEDERLIAQKLEEGRRKWLLDVKEHKT